MQPPSCFSDKFVAGCTLEKCVLNPLHLDRIRDAVSRIHISTMMATELLNLHFRRVVSNYDVADLELFLDGSRAKQAWTAVSTSIGAVNPSLAASHAIQLEHHQGLFIRTDASRLDQCFKFEADKFATAARTNIWYHFRRRVMKLVRAHFDLTKDEYKSLDVSERKRRGIQLKKICWDVCRIPGEECKSEEFFHPWIEAQRRDMHFHSFDWDGKCLEYNAKKYAHQFLIATWKLSCALQAIGHKTFSVLPLRRSLVPRYVSIDTRALQSMLGLGTPMSTRIRKREREEARRTAEQHVGTTQARAPKAKKEDVIDEHSESWNSVFDLHRVFKPDLISSGRSRFNFFMSTDGVGCSFSFVRLKRHSGQKRRTMPRRGLWAIDELKHLFRSCGGVECSDDPCAMVRLLDERMGSAQAIGVDPGKMELAVAVDPLVAYSHSKISTVRYTAAQRRIETGSAIYNLKLKEPIALEKRAASIAYKAMYVRTPPEIKEHVASLSTSNSMSPLEPGFVAYVQSRAEVLGSLLMHYAEIHHRSQRWLRRKKSQHSVACFAERIKAMKRDGKDVIVLGWGAWGATAGRPGQVCHRKKPPTMGANLMRKISKVNGIVVVKVPEYNTTKTCCRCGGQCARHTAVERNLKEDHPRWKRSEIRGLRLCQNSECRRPLNRDANAAVNIGSNLMRSLFDLPLISTMSDEDVELAELSASVPSDD